MFIYPLCKDKGLSLVFATHKLLNYLVLASPKELGHPECSPEAKHCSGARLLALTEVDGVSTSL